MPMPWERQWDTTDATTAQPQARPPWERNWSGEQAEQTEASKAAPVAQHGFMDDLTNPDPTTYYGSLLPIAREASGAKRMGAPEFLQEAYKALTAPSRVLRGEVPFDQMNDEARNMALQLMGGGAATSMAPEIVPAGAMAMNAMGRPVKAVAKAATAVAQPIVDRFDTEGAMGRTLAKRIMQQNPGMTLDEAIAATETQLNTLGPEGVLADTGRATKNLARTMIHTPGETAARAEKILGDRDASEVSRMVNSIEQNVTKSKFYDTDAINQQSKAKAGPFYEKSYAANPNVSSEGLQLLLEQEPLIRQGINKGVELQRIEASTARRKFDPSRYGVVDFDVAGAPILGQETPLRLWHAAREGLDAIIQEYPKFPNGKPILDKRGRAIERLRGSLGDEIKDLTGGAKGDFAKGDAIYADASKLNEALHRGRSFVNGDEEITEKVFTAMRPTEQAAFRSGVAREMIGMIRKTGSTPANIRNALRDTGIRDKLKVILPTEEKFNGFINDLQREATFKDTNRLRGGSQTFGLGSDDADAAGDMLGNVLGAGADLARGNVSGVTGRILGAAQNFIKRAQIPQASRDRIGKLLISQDPVDKAEALRLIRKVKSSGWVYAP